MDKEYRTVLAKRIKIFLACDHTSARGDYLAAHLARIKDRAMFARPKVFFTSLGKRAFEAICEMEKSEQGFDFSALGERFAPDEMGRLVRLQQDRQALVDNSVQVLRNAAGALIEARQKQNERDAGDLQAELARRRAAMKRKN